MTVSDRIARISCIVMVSSSLVCAGVVMQRAGWFSESSRPQTEPYAERNVQRSRSALSDALVSLRNALDGAEARTEALEAGLQRWEQAQGRIEEGIAEVDRTDWKMLREMEEERQESAEASPEEIRRQWYSYHMEPYRKNQPAGNALVDVPAIVLGLDAVRTDLFQEKFNALVGKIHALEVERAKVTWLEKQKRFQIVVRPFPDERETILKEWNRWVSDFLTPSERKKYRFYGMDLSFGGFFRKEGTVFGRVGYMFPNPRELALPQYAPFYEKYKRSR